MVNACPQESDPRPKVSEFVSNDDVKVISGLVSEGLDTLLQIVIDELRKANPEAETILLDRDFLSDNNITFARELESFLSSELDSGKKINLVVISDLPLNGWNLVLEKFAGRDLKAFYGSIACKRVPICSKVKL